MPLVLIQPQSVGDGNVGVCLPWYTARRLCCSTAALVGGSDGYGFSLQTVCVCGVPRRYQLRCLFCRKTVGVHGIFINMIRYSGEKSECLVSSGRAVHSPHYLCCLLSMSGEAGDRVAVRQSIKHW